LALFIILAGSFLILGGLISLLSGFDIVMTERGSAMTIGGTIALSGGVIAVGIGFSLLRLSQILRALESTVEEEAEIASDSMQKDLPALSPIQSGPIGPLENPASKATGGPDNEEDTILISPLTRKDIHVPASRPGFLRTSGLKSSATAGSAGTVVAGAVAGVAVAGAAIIAMGKNPEAVENEEAETNPGISALNPALEFQATESTDLTGLDLDAELSRALAEDFQAPHAIDAADEDVRFNKGLTEVLSKPRKRGKKETGHQEIGNQETGHQETGSRNALREAGTADARIKMSAPTTDGQQDPAQELEIEESLFVQNTQSSESLSHDQSSATQDSTHKPDPDAVKEAASEETSGPTILGTYNADDGTYIMYSDGSVEAISESGVKKFSSMEDLRTHLSKAQS
jgi:hypothetical protein